MKTYVLGAGASRHAGYPLAANLGEALRDWIYRTKPVNDDSRIHIDQLTKLYGGLANIEETLTDLDMCWPGSPAATLPTHVRAYLLPSFRESIREFFNDRRQGPAPLYERLASERVRPGDVIVTFNYEMACERELKQAVLWEIGDGYGFSLGLDTLPESPVKVLKLHGSTNWFGLYFGGTLGFSQVSSVLDLRPTLFFRPDFDFLGYSNEIRDPQCMGIDRAAGKTALIMPTRRKRFFEQTTFGREWESFWQHLWGQAEHALASSDEIVIIGFGMATIDEKARDLLLNKSNRDARLAVFSGRRSVAICDEFRAHGFRRIETSGEGRFEDYLDRNG